MTRLAAAVGWLLVAALAWYARRQFGDGYEEGREETLAELGVAL